MVIPRSLTELSVFDDVASIMTVFCFYLQMLQSTRTKDFDICWKLLLFDEWFAHEVHCERYKEHSASHQHSAIVRTVLPNSVCK